VKITFTCKDPEELAEAAEILVNFFKDARVFVFSGEPGAGKTTFIKAICKELGVIDPVSSPTYGLLHEYVRSKGEKIYHFDFYRINDSTEAIDIGLEEYLESGQYCLIEWPVKISGLVPADAVSVIITQQGDSRLIVMEREKGL
jgi:tRNA threonylcarbamoyladenosine biosynthesis protein TsaE